MYGLESYAIVVQVTDNEMQKYMAYCGKYCNKSKCGCQLVLLVNRQPLEVDPHITLVLITLEKMNCVPHEL